VTACAVGPDYVKPDIACRKAIRHAPVPSPGPALKVEDWWNNFNDPVLVRIVERALAQNLDLAASMARVEQARAAARRAPRTDCPTGSADAQAARQRQSLESPLGALASSRPGYQRDATLYNAGLGATWELDLAGGLRRGAEADNAEAQAAEADHAGVRVSIAAEAADAYFRVRSAQARIELARAQIKTDGDLLTLVQSRLREGMSTAREQAQAQARVAQVRATLPALQAEQETQLNRLDVLMAATPGTYAAEFAELAGQADIPADGHGADAARPAAQKTRCDRGGAAPGRVQRAHRRGDGGILSARSRSRPCWATRACARPRRRPPTSSPWRPSACTGACSISAVWTPSSRAPKARGPRRLARYRQSLLRATEDVENALVRQWQLDAEHKELLLEVDADTRARGATQQAYEGGVLNLMELLEQDRQLLAARDQLVRVQSDSGRAVVATFRAMGGGW
jgi:outer membrane protein TolC